jgi:hypothetical protein
VDGAGVLGVNPAKRAGIVLEQLEVEPVVFGSKIGLLAVVPALGDVMGKPWQNQARRSGQIAQR